MASEPSEQRALLLDTHALLWWAADDARLPSGARTAITERRVLLSVVSPWELVVKQAVGRIELLDTPRSLIRDQIARNGFELLPIALEHVLEIGELPLHHADPFDRMLIAQAEVEDLTLVTRDPAFGDYDVPTLWH